MIKFVYISILFLGQASFASVCGGVVSKVFDSVNLSLETLHDSGVYEEGLSFHEYPGFDLELEADGTYYLSVGAAGFSGADNIELVCVNEKFELHVIYGGEVDTVVKDFKYEDGEVTAVSVIALSRENGFEKIADFTTEGKKVMIAYLEMVEKPEQPTLLSQYVEVGDSLEIDVDFYGDHYEITIGELVINTYPGNEMDATAMVVDKTLYVEVPTMNIYIEIRATDIYFGNVDEARVFVGELDSTAPAMKVGLFEY